MPPQPGAMRSRWTAYAALSATLAGGVILKALAQRPNIYSASVYLWQSSANLMILCNMIFVAACSFLIFLQKVLYGPLRTSEIEHLYEKAWFAVTETCLAMTIFRGEIGAWFLVMFFSLLAGKVWGWIGEGRVEVLEQQQHNILAGPNARLFHTRLALSLALSVLFDVSMLDYVVGQVLHMARPDMMVMFGFEFAVLTVASLSTATRYALNLIEIGIVRGQKKKRMDAIRKQRVDAAVRRIQPQDSPISTGEDGAVASRDLEQRRAQAAAAAASLPIDDAEVEVEGWEGKGRWVFYLDLTTDFCKLVIYLSFFFILLIFYGLPLHIMRDVFLTCRSFVKRIGDFMRYRTATRDMNERYPDATAAEIGDNECIICREEMHTYVPPAPGAAADPVAERMRPKKLPCGHVLHFACLRSWLERQQICPTCRATVVPAAPPPQAPAVVPQGVAARAQHAPNGGNGGPRVFQIGPLRIGVGAARGNNMFEELQEQLANINPAPAPAPAPAQNANGPQQYGIGIRWDGIRRRAQGGHRAPRGTIQENLDAAERQIQRELDSLQSSMGEVQALRNVQAQLARIRLARQAPTGPTQQPAAAQSAPPLPRATTTSAPGITSLAAQPQQGVLRAGSDNLPEGLTLPEGWTMMPLQPMQAQPLAPPMIFNSAAMPPNVPAASHIPQMPIVLHPDAQAQPPLQVDPELADILREVQEVIQGAASSPEASGQSSQMQNPHQYSVIESIRLQNQAEQSRERMAELSNQLRNVANIATTAAEAQSSPAESSRALSSATNLQSSARRVHPRANTPQSPSTTPQARAQQQQQQQQQQNLPSQGREQSRQSASQSPQSSPSVLPSVQQINRTIPPQQRTSQTSRPPTVAGTDANGNPRSSVTATVNPPRQLSSTSQASVSTNDSTRTKSPHRPTRSIGSSWGFPSAENHGNEDDDDDEDDEDENSTESDTEGKHSQQTAKRPGERPRSLAEANVAASTSSPSSNTAKGKTPTVEDLAEDPD